MSGASRVKLILDLRAVTLELAAHPKVCLVVPDAATEIGGNERIARDANLASRDHDLLAGALDPAVDLLKKGFLGRGCRRS